MTSAEIITGLSQSTDPNATQAEKEASFGRFWDAYFALVDSGWRPRDTDIQFDYDEEREHGWSI